MGDLVKAAENCSSTLEGIDGQAIENAGLLKPELGSGDYVTMAAWATFDSVVYHYTVSTAVEVPLWDYSTTAPSADWVVDVDGNITRAPFITGPEQVGSRGEIQDVEHTGTKKAWTGMRTPINQWAYERFDWYKNRVDTHSTLYTQGGPRFWDVKGRILDFDDAMRNGGKLTKALRVAGPIATVATIGLTYKGEYDQAEAELVADHPDWTQDEISARAREMAGVQGTVQVGLDIGAGMAGAAIGTAMGGPVGTVIGFGVGIGLSWVLNESGIGDGIRDIAQAAWDGGKDLLGERRRSGQRRVEFSVRIVCSPSVDVGSQELERGPATLPTGVANDKEAAHDGRTTGPVGVLRVRSGEFHRRDTGLSWPIPSLADAQGLVDARLAGAGFLVSRGGLHDDRRGAPSPGVCATLASAGPFLPVVSESGRGHHRRVLAPFLHASGLDQGNPQKNTSRRGSALPGTRAWWCTLWPSRRRCPAPQRGTGRAPGRETG